MFNEDEKDMQGYLQNNLPKVPTPFKRYLRNCLLYQLVRFFVINIKMIIVVKKSH